MAATEKSAGGAGAADDFYVDDVDFNSGYVHRLSPAVMGYVARYRGAADGAVPDSFRYCELACGDGSTTNALAGLFPEAEFVGVDFNANHIEMAEQAARDFGLNNVSFICCSFEDLPDHNLPQFDFMGINGAYGWLTPDLRQSVREFLASNLADGGLFAVEYLSLPGKAAIQAMWKTVQKLLPVDAFETSQERGVAGIKFLNAFNASNPLSFNMHPSIKNATRRYVGQGNSGQGNVDHFVHNALAGGFDARYFCDVYDEMSEVGLHYAGRVDNIAQNDESFALGPARYRLLSQYDSPRERELIRDFILNTDSRCDLYMKIDQQPEVKLGQQALEPYYAMAAISYDELNAKPYRQLFSTDDIEFVVALDGSQSLAEVFAGEEIALGRLSLINRLLDTNEVYLSATRWQAMPETIDQVSCSCPIMNHYLERMLERKANGGLPVPGMINRIKYNGVEVCLIAMLLEFGLAQTMALLEDRLGKQTETLPGKYVTSLMRRKKPKVLLEIAQTFYSSSKFSVLVRSGALLSG